MAMLASSVVCKLHLGDNNTIYKHVTPYMVQDIERIYFCMYHIVDGLKITAYLINKKNPK